MSGVAKTLNEYERIYTRETFYPRLRAWQWRNCKRFKCWIKI